MDDELGSAIGPVRGEMARLKDETDKAREALAVLQDAGDKASRAIEAGLLRAVRTGRFGFEDLGRIALSILSQIAATAVRSGLQSIGIGSGPSWPQPPTFPPQRDPLGGLIGLGSSLIGGLLGLPGRATGGPVSPGRAYLVGERGPEVFLPTNSGQVMPGGGGQGAPRDVRVSITVNGNGQDAPQALARSARQVARAVRGALGE
jgi:phage-related minor tail protein